MVDTSNATDFIKSNIGLIGAGVGGAAIGAGVGSVVTAGIIKKRAKKSKRKAKHKSSKRRTTHKRKLKFGSKAYRKRYLGKRRHHKQRKPHTAGKRKDTSHKRIRYTKNNQPYIILSSGKARFISKKNVHRSRKLKGGKY